MKLFLIGLVIGVFLFILFISFSLGSKADQPISFNHQKHTEQGLECDTCHPFFKDQTFAGMPTVATCMECHKEPITQSPEEEKIRRYAKKNKQPPWKRLYVVPDHVFFSHRRHVLLGKLECPVCHGNIAGSKEPPSKPWVNMTMNWCMNCHKTSSVTNDCLACHE